MNNPAKFIFIIALFCTLQANAQDYLISFAENGSAKSLTSVRVENLAKGTDLMLNGSDVLHLVGNLTTGIGDNNEKSGMKIYPNPMIESSVIEIHPPHAGDAIVTIYDISGRELSRNRSYLDNSTQEFNISGEYRQFDQSWESGDQPGKTQC